ncbi:MAG: transglycosylase SLT domain-containing protein [Deltaproteobacteria bacterium]|nr:transglycosylase SLT domain-containing protein [Deltaproteobacteria bacterium]
MLGSLLVLGLALAGPGTVLPVAPTSAPGRVAPTPADPLAAAIEARNQGDLARAIWNYESWLAKKNTSARLRAAVQLALGLAYLDNGDPNLASALFSKVRASGTPVAPWGAWYEALADHERGRHSVAASECAAYRKNWPEGPHADECLVLMGDAHVAAGNRGPAVAAYQQYIATHPDSPREESLRLGIALAVSNTDPAQGIPMLQSLVLDHAYHSTGDSARARLDELAREGFDTALPADGITACRLAAERKRCGYEREAWAMFQELTQRAATDPAVAQWIDSHDDQFKWGTKQYIAVAATLAEQYAARPDAEIAWQRYRALAKGGDWKGAAQQLVDGAKAHPGSRFRSAREELARAQLLAGEYADARDGWTAIGKSGGALGKEARWLAAFSAYRLGDWPDALKRLEAIDDGDDWTGDAARFFRVRTLQKMGEADKAKAAGDEIVADNPWSWYAALLRGDIAGETVTRRAGRWPGPRLSPADPLPRVTHALPPVAAPTGGDRPVASAAAFAPAPVAASEWKPGRSWDERPEAYASSFLFDPAEGARLLDELQANHPDLFPDAQAASDLARAGAFDLAAPLVARMYDAIDPNVGGTARPEVTLDVGDWRQVFLLVRDHYHVARFSWGTHKIAATPDQKVAAWRLTFPTAEADPLWRHGQRYDVDPLLALGLMRQESVYRQWALSPVGAIGLMQVMPRTGARIAARMGDPTYSPEVLENPSTNVRYGMWYLGQLLDRFGGAWPLAVASYNGGPHNVSAWLRPWGDQIPLEDFVEHIPYPETRDYVKKVGGYYVSYVALYGEPDDLVVVPGKVTRDDPTTVDF